MNLSVSETPRYGFDKIPDSACVLFDVLLLDLHPQRALIWLADISVAWVGCCTSTW